MSTMEIERERLPDCPEESGVTGHTIFATPTCGTPVSLTFSLCHAAPRRPPGDAASHSMTA